MPLDMIHPDEALALVLENLPPAALESLPLAEALGRALPRGVSAAVDQPPFSKSAMDGFAYAGDTGGGGFSSERVWRVVSLVAAGERGGSASRVLEPGECARIMTGAPIPPGATAVQRVEWSEAVAAASGDAVVRFTKPEPVSNIIAAGENLKAGELLLGPRLLAAQDLGILASGGVARVEVARRPRVGVLSTGDELVEAGEPLGPSSIYDSNGPTLAALAEAAGAEARHYGIVRDEPGLLKDALALALDECDVVLVSGGVSMGDFDYVPRTLESLGVVRIFHKIAMKPGKPTWFGRRGPKAVFGLPGNPVSTFVNFEFLVKPHLLARMGLAHEPRVVAARLAATVRRRDFDRVEFIPMRLSREAGREAEVALPLVYNGSSMLSVLAEADCLVRAEIGVPELKEGSLVAARLVRP